MSRSPPRMASPTPRQRILSFLGGRSATSSAADDASLASSTPPPPVSQLQLQGDPQPPSDVATPPQSTPAPGPALARRASVDQSHQPLQRKPSRNVLLRRRSSASSHNTASNGLFRKRSTSGISNKDLPPASSDLDDTLTSVSGATAGARSPSPTKMFSPRSGAATSTSSATGITAPPGSPTKRSRALFPSTRNRKDSTASLSSAGISGGPSPLSRPSSPIKDLFGSSQGSAQDAGARKGGIDKSLIGLPTNFKHTGGGGMSSPSLDTAIALPGLEAHLPPSSPLVERGRKISAPSSPRARQNVNGNDPTLQSSLAQIDAALNNGNGNDENDEATDMLVWQPRDARLDTVKEVPSGFIQRFEKMGQAPGPQGGGGAGGDGLGGLGRGGTRADARALFGSMEASPSDPGQPGSPGGARRLASQPPSSPPMRQSSRPSSPLRSVSPPAAGSRPWPARASSPSPSPTSAFTEVGINSAGDDGRPASPFRPSSPTRMGRRKPVPSLGTEREAAPAQAPCSPPPQQQQQQPYPPKPSSPPPPRPTSPPPQPPVARAPATPALRQPSGPPASAGQQDWAATLAEINEALNAPLPSSTSAGAGAAATSGRGFR